jgi:hypothetical protein
MGLIIIAIILFLFFGRNLNLGAALTPVIQNSSTPVVTGPPGTTPGIPGPSAYNPVAQISNPTPSPSLPPATATPIFGTSPLPGPARQAPITVVSQLPITGRVGRQTYGPENGGTFFSAPRATPLVLTQSQAALYKLYGGKLPYTVQ